MKPLMPKDSSVVGTTSLIPIADTDEKFIPADTQGENLYTNPPDPNMPFVDHGLDEESIWGFRKTNYNQQVIHNPYARGDIWSAKDHNAPWWGQKLGTPAFYKDSKWGKFIQQYNIRLGFEILKMKHASELRTGDLKQRDQMKNEVLAYLADADEQMLERELKDVYVTDHKPVTKKFVT